MFSTFCPHRQKVEPRTLPKGASPLGIPLWGWALAPFSLWSNGADGACCASAPGRPAELRSKRISLGLIGGLWGVVIPRGLFSTPWAEIPREWVLFYLQRAAQQVQIITPLYPIAHSKRRLKATFAQHRETGNLPPLPSPSRRQRRRSEAHSSHSTSLCQTNEKTFSLAFPCKGRGTACGG